MNREELEIFKEEINNNIVEMVKNKSDINDFKLISDAFQDMKLNMTQKVDDIDNDLDRLMENKRMKELKKQKENESRRNNQNQTEEEKQENDSSDNESESDSDLI